MTRHRTSNIEEGLFVSDLHLFSGRTGEREMVDSLRGLSRPEQCLVLGGDIFDFRWSRHGGIRDSSKAARIWLDLLLERTGQAKVIYLPGNHDCHPHFLRYLEALAERTDRFQWHRHWWQLQDCLFLHGDILATRGCEIALDRYRRRFHHHRPPPALLHQTYELAVGLRAHRWVPQLVHRPKTTCRRLLRLIRMLPIESFPEVRRVFFGHTHVPINGLTIDGVEFYNPGAGLRHMRPQPQHFRL
ncbi:MAG: hypothetical protein KatS3mg111_2862 [Pirellulaceae bacterium]|nr:MAG: hypothetical protein KatS3mg111_2862 [Pirellulaceae bacterium]